MFKFKKSQAYSTCKQEKMTAPRMFHLFTNCDRQCDRVYKLDSIEDLLMATKAKHGLEFTVVKHYFSLSAIPKLIGQFIPELKVDCAFLAVQASEIPPRPYEFDTLGVGYPAVYEALRKATGKSL